MKSEEEIKARIKELEDDNKRFLRKDQGTCLGNIFAAAACIRNQAHINVLKWVLDEKISTP